jgi:hypothetical protein
MDSSSAGSAEPSGTQSVMMSTDEMHEEEDDEYIKAKESQLSHAARICRLTAAVDACR